MIRPATREDLPAIATIQSTSPESAQWRPEEYLVYDCLVAVEDGRVAGFLVSRRTAPDQREILNLCVDPSRRRQGVARRLLEHALASVPGEWFLEVRESNEAAFNLYKQFGFHPFGRREDYYRDPAEAAIVMKIDSWYCHGAQPVPGGRLP